ncbi:hypothetical protein V5J35_000840 [Endozoicomonas sp. NE40]|uniref:Uncharacterized protein n=1 Tax=Endozoicomonas lisbonensis TaxID=3120522 RepID=A0ABV2SD01_9GAMM
MKKFNYSLARERVELATAIILFLGAGVGLATEVLTFLSVAFNYSKKNILSCLPNPNGLASSK